MPGWTTIDSRCHIHPDALAGNMCHRCLQPVCATCTMVYRLKLYCPMCLGEVRRRRILLIASTMAAALLLTIAGFVFRGPILLALKGPPGRADDRITPGFNADVSYAMLTCRKSW